jgi:hypothetical protein
MYVSLTKKKLSTTTGQASGGPQSVWRGGGPCTGKKARPAARLFPACPGVPFLGLDFCLHDCTLVETLPYKNSSPERLLHIHLLKQKNRAKLLPCAHAWHPPLAPAEGSVHKRDKRAAAGWVGLEARTVPRLRRARGQNQVDSLDATGLETGGGGGMEQGKVRRSRGQRGTAILWPRAGACWPALREAEAEALPSGGRRQRGCGAVVPRAPPRAAARAHHPDEHEQRIGRAGHNQRQPQVNDDLGEVMGARDPLKQRACWEAGGRMVRCVGWGRPVWPAARGSVRACVESSRGSCHGRLALLSSPPSNALAPRLPPELPPTRPPVPFQQLAGPPLGIL